MNSQVLCTSLRHSHPSYCFQTELFSLWNPSYVIPFPCHLHWLNCASCASEQPHLSWGRHTFEMPHVCSSICTYTYPETHTEQPALLCTLFFIPTFSILRHYVHLNTHTPPFLISFFKYYFSAYTGGRYI